MCEAIVTPISKHNMHHLSIDRPVHSKVRSVCQMSLHVVQMQGKNSASVSIVVSCTKVLRCPQMKMSNRFRSGDCQPCHWTTAVNLSPWICIVQMFRWLHIWILKGAGAPSCMYHAPWRTWRGTSSSNFGSVDQKIKVCFSCQTAGKNMWNGEEIIQQPIPHTQRKALSMQMSHEDFRVSRCACCGN